MNSILVNNTTQPLANPYTFILPVISSTTVHIKILEEQTIRHYNEFIIAIMKVIDIQYVTHCTDDQYQLITIYRVGDTLIHILPSKTLIKHLLKQKDKQNSIKTGVYCIKQSTIQ